MSGVIGRAPVRAGVRLAMRFLSHILPLVLLTGCSVQHGQVDFVSPPLFQLNFGQYRSLMVYNDSTVLRLGGAYYFLSVPLWLLATSVVGCIAIATCIVYIMRKRHEQKVEQIGCTEPRDDASV
jgi:heme A synthase